MNKFKILKLFLLFDVLIIIFLVSYKLYSYISEPNYTANNIHNIESIQKVPTSGNYSFAVIGGIDNSFDIFDDYLVKKINNDPDLQFLVSSGNAVMDGAEDKYRILNKSLAKVTIPKIITFGENEYADGGAARFYNHYGPYYYSFTDNNAYFIFLDTTGYTSYDVEKQWLNNELIKAQNSANIFVFMNKSPIVFTEDTILKSTHYIEDPTFRDFLTSSFSEYHVTAVFSSNAKIYLNEKIGGVNYFISGGGGGVLNVNSNNSYYHYLKVSVNGTNVSYQVIKQATPTTFPIFRILQNIWIYIHSVFYLNYLNFFIILSFFALIAFLVYIKVNKEVDYYRNFDISDEEIIPKKHLKIAMFTNNYLPFIGGVPISINRLAKGLRKRGHEVYIFAPNYPNAKSDEMVIRCKLLLPKRKHSFVITNIFSHKINKQFALKNFDVIHVHHPFWMGEKGLQLGKKYHIPVVFTYHTRLELYAHMVPVFKKTFKNIVSHKMIFHFAQKCDGIIAPTTSASEYLSEIGVSRHKTVLPTGIDFDNYQINQTEIAEIKQKYKQDKEILLCTVSRLSSEKNIYFLLNGLKYIKEHTNISFKCMIIGEGNEKEGLLKVIQDENLEEEVLLLGPIAYHEIARYYLAADIFVFSSKSETQGMVVLEAMAGKTPVVAINSSGINDVILNHFNGFKTKDNLVDWSKKVISLMENRSLLKELSENAYRFSQQYSLEEMGKVAEDLYRYVIIHKQFTNKHGTSSKQDTIPYKK